MRLDRGNDRNSRKGEHSNVISNPRVRVGLVGAGAIGRTYVQALAGSHEAELVAVADVAPGAAEAAAAAAGVPAFDSSEELLRSIELDAVVICTPPVTHPELCVTACQAGRHVLCEKPLSIRVADARRMLAAAEQAGVLLTMASKFRYAADVQRAKEIVDSGLLGEIVLFENTFTSHVDMSRRWNSDPAISGGGVLIDNGTHSLDLLRHFLGPIKELQVVEGRRVQRLAVEDTVRIFVRSKSHVMGSVDLSWSIHKPLPGFIEIYGSQGSLSVGWKESKYRLGSGPWQVFGSGYDKLQSFVAQIENFARAIRGQEALRCTPADGLASVEAVAAAYEALNRNRWTAIGGRGFAPLETAVAAL